ncbi:hypothetical protein COCOBI_19-2400 [Coccomyxa sp. Obi]|nr:hypothetical protein COCOBI_19-2400 [Coccomyxa sp. Obi]
MDMANPRPYDGSTTLFAAYWSHPGVPVAGGRRLSRLPLDHKDQESSNVAEAFYEVA